MTGTRPGATTIAPDLPISRLVRDHPETRPILARHGLCACGGVLGPNETIRFFARMHGLDLDRLLGELEWAIDNPLPPGMMRPEGRDLAVYRRYFVGGIMLALIAGLAWGSWMLLGAASTAPVAARDRLAIHAHGQAQVFGWVGLFLMGFSYLVLPRIWRTELVAPGLSAAVFVLMVVGLIARTSGLIAAALGAPVSGLATLGGALQLGAVAAFAGQIAATFHRSRAPMEPYVAFVLAGLGWFVLSAALSLGQTESLLAAGAGAGRAPAAPEAAVPLHDLQIHGLALFLMVGLAMRMVPALFGLPRVADRRAWWALDFLTTALVGEVVLQLAYRYTGNRGFAACLPVTRLMLAAGVALIVVPWHPWLRTPEPAAPAKYVRAAYAWLALSLLLLLAGGPTGRSLVGGEPAPATLAAARHAMSLGYLTILIMGLTARLVPILHAAGPDRLGGLWGPFLLVNLGCLARVLGGLLPAPPGIAPVWLGASGVLEVAGLAWWGGAILRDMTVAAPSETGAAIQLPGTPATAGPGPRRQAGPPPAPPRRRGEGSSILMLPG